jgi:hypothetical protein
MLGQSISSVREDYPGNRLDGRLVRSVSRQLLLAVDYLHSAGVAHGGEFHRTWFLVCYVGLILSRYSPGKCAFSSPRVGSIAPRPCSARPRPSGGWKSREARWCAARTRPA